MARLIYEFTACQCPTHYAASCTESGSKHVCHQPRYPLMTDPYFQTLFAERIGGANYGKGSEIYKFEKIKRAKRKALAEHPERRLIDFGIGENDEMAPESVRAVMGREINRPENRGYADNGIAAYKEAAARFMQRNFGVELDSATEVNH